MAISSKQNKSTKNSLVPNCIRICVENHNGFITYEEFVPPAFYYGTVERLKSQYGEKYKVYSI